MRLPVQLRVTLRRSRIAMLALISAWAAGAGLLLILPTPAWLDALAAAGLAGWAHHHWGRHASRRSRHAVVEVMLSTDAVVVVRYRDERLVAGAVRASTFVHPWFTTIVWRPDGRWFSRRLPILPDMLDADAFRRVRVMLRYGKSEVEAGAPANQA
jgi:hypothetical protein